MQSDGGYAISEGNYTTLVLIDLTEHVFAFNLSHLEMLLHTQLGEEDSMFIRTGKRLIISKHSKKCTLYAVGFDCSFALAITIKPK